MKKPVISLYCDRLFPFLFVFVGRFRLTRDPPVGVSGPTGKHQDNKKHTANGLIPYLPCWDVAFCHFFIVVQKKYTNKKNRYKLFPTKSHRQSIYFVD